jgi:acyl-CoA synthetase (AMP-forming)/AMP-acid ligase II
MSHHQIRNKAGISPEHVEAVLAGCRGVTEAAVYPVPDPLYGERVGASVVVSQADDVGSEEILQQFRGLLAPFEMPDRLRLSRRCRIPPKGTRPACDPGSRADR